MMGRLQNVRIETGARLHFGLLGTSAPFGGLGVMIDQPKTIVEIVRSDRFRVEPCVQERAVEIAKRFSRLSGQRTLPGVSIRALRLAPPHGGFGSGTQLSLAIADGLCQIFNVQIPCGQLASEIADRGKRSAVGVHGYFHGGLLFESQGEGHPPLNALQARIEPPDPWRLVLVRPMANLPVVSGDLETAQFARLRNTPHGSSDALRKQITEKILPAVQAGAFADFASSVEQYNHASGMLFADAQGGPYNGKVVSQTIAALKALGAVGVGQSSWGPGVFAWCEDLASAQALASSMDHSAVDVQITGVKKDGRRIHVDLI
jgi:beta-RFAP synthase